MPFKLRYFIPALLLLAAAAAATVSLTYSRRQAELRVESQAKRQMIQNLSHLQSVLEYLLAQGDMERAQEQVAALGSDPFVVAAVLVDASNTVVAALEQRSIGRKLDEVLPKRRPEQAQLRAARIARIRHSMIGEVGVWPDSVTLRGVYPVLMGGASTSLRPTQVGLIYVLRDLQPLKAQAMRTVEYQVLLYSGFLVVLSVLMAFIFHFVITRRVRRLASVAEQIGSGILNTSARLRGNDELAELGRTFDAMAARRKQVEEKLFEQKERAEITLHSIGDAVITTNAEGRIEYCNPEAAHLTGWSDGEAKGKPLAEVFKIFDEFTREPLESPIWECLADGTVVTLGKETLILNRNGGEIAIEDSVAPIRDQRGRILGAVLVFHDVSLARKMAHQLSWQATHDALTELVNRRQFEHVLSRAISSAKLHGLEHAMLYMDLDQFKLVNDTCGHVAGDELLKQLTAVIEQKMRDTDTLARLGGDEFGVLLEHCPLEQAQRVAEDLCETVKTFRFVWEEKTFMVGVSIGLVPITTETENREAVLTAADMACYVAKDLGRNRVHVYQEGEAGLVKRHGEMQWVARIRQALQENRFQLCRQAIVPVSRDIQCVEHYEVLLRLVDEAGSVVPPGAFLSAAERYGLMPLIDRWVVGTLFANYGRKFREQWGMYKARESGGFYTINISGVTLSDHAFLDFVRERLQQWDVPPSMICFEITETAAIANLPHAIRFIHELQAVGCRFALDDFGSGFSSFAYLRNLPVDYLKIDGSFVKDMEMNPVDHAMVEAINNIGHVLGIRTIAEYVERPATMDSLRELKVDLAQGFEIGMPEALEIDDYSAGFREEYAWK
jgi:diguanylate cyclase (GGDEF)-like protein/PAS domain S-box-containing protein